MNSYKRLIAIVMFVLLFQQGRTQLPSKQDSTFAARLHQLSATLALSPAQEQAFLVIEKQQQASKDSLAHLRLSVSEHKAWLRVNLKKHEESLKKLMDAHQWRTYMALLEEKRKAFLQYAADKKLRVVEISF